MNVLLCAHLILLSGFGLRVSIISLIHGLSDTMKLSAFTEIMRLWTCWYSPTVADDQVVMPGIPACKLPVMTVTLMPSPRNVRLILSLGMRTVSLYRPALMWMTNLGTLQNESNVSGRSARFLHFESRVVLTCD
jgi:hypothetical protein